MVLQVSLPAHSLVPKCTSCGITLQKTEPQAAGYFIEPKASVPDAQKAAKANPTRLTDKIFDDHFRDLSDEDKSLLLNGAEMDLLSPRNRKPISPSQQERSGHQCLRCRNAHHRSAFDAAEYQTESVAQVMQRVPEDGHLVYVVSLVDFPLSLNEDVFRFRSAKSIQYVITKSDLLFPTNNLASRYGTQFFQDYMHRTYGVPQNHVHVVSGKSDWNTDTFLASIRNNSFFIGSVNSGKSTLLQLVMQVVRKQRESLPNARKERDRQKKQDDIISNARSYAAARLRLRMWEKQKTDIGPGSSFMPGFTRDIIPLELSKSTTVFDVPGFSSKHAAHLYDFLSAKSIKQLQKGALFHKHGTYLSKYVTAKEGQVVTVGGLFFLQVPRGCMYQVRNVINHKVHVFSNMEKAMQVWKDAKDPNAVRDVFLVDHLKTDVEKHVVPPFDGSCDIVLRGLGFVNIKATGARPDPATAEDVIIYLPKGISAVSRVPISKYITKTLSGRDKGGNVLRKEKWVQMSTKELKRYTGKEPFFWPIIPLQ
ncbi:hypothetical protein METBIDRAFT_88234 [Metschnikowia bicuspidata var. bicuspidata NRRL YB-4993]|uniref:Genetic interactor of prohibitins 3, mitochondrial n=1 Tax=Metschnikowia bicuspidata var. bicuspidata NRRL YB-4993 TaxID=869754 RepID=A0A1A0H6S6_9ASCO|nr:hypothetical protein METBIDRAFT_88234 [Metschnikowia bicuspidata var. bicuspidata NRRL YB-4993]OBA19731.1 hypothetical protein METBIDRAFT_88234 [Metschnikowia bicuspidata var. bicuspidata NRRL YB-4993]